jgi:hypothetical protein
VTDISRIYSRIEGIEPLPQYEANSALAFIEIKLNGKSLHSRVVFGSVIKRIVPDSAQNNPNG